MRRILWFLLVMLLTACTSSVRYTEQIRLPSHVINYHIPNLTVGEFTNKAGRVYGWNLSYGLQEQLIHGLTTSRYFNVLNREKVSDAVAELQLQQTGLTREQGKMQLGNMRNTRYVVRGAITAFEQTNDTSVWGFIKDSILSADQQVAVVQINLYVEDMQANQIIASTSISESVSATQVNYNALAFGGSSFFKTPLGEATQSVIEQAVEYIVNAIPKERWHPTVAQHTDTFARYTKNEQLYITGGKDRDLVVGSRWAGFEVGEVIRDPATGDVLGTSSASESGGVIEIIQVENKYSIARVVSGELMTGDMLKKQMPVNKDTSDKVPSEN